MSPIRYRSPPRHYRQRPEDHGSMEAIEPRYRHRPTHSHLQIKPETFDGTDDWDQYISHFQNCAELGRWSDSDKTLTLASCLKGQARSFYLGLTPFDRNSYPGLVRKLTERFGSTRQQNRYLTRFETRVRKPGEDIAALGDDLRLIAQRAYPNLGPDAQETLALHQLYKIIPIEMKCRCIDRDCGTIGAAVQIIERYEALLGDHADRKRTSVRAIDKQFNRGYSAPNGSDSQPRNYLDQSNYNQKNELQQVLDRLQKLEGPQDRRNPGPERQHYRPSGATRRYSTMPRQCYACDSEDHFLRECPIYRKFLDGMHKDKRNSENSIPPSS